jgi:hypothetical protein
MRALTRACGASRWLAGATVAAAASAAGQSPAPRDRQPQQPIWIASWGRPGQETSNVFPMVRVAGEFSPFTDGEALDPEPIARQLERLPKGRRSVLLLRYGGTFWGVRGDAIDGDGRAPAVPTPWAERAIAEIRREWPRTLSLLKHCGADMDLLVLDFESWGCMNTWHLDAAGIDALRSDPRWGRPSFGIEPLAASLAELREVAAADIRRPGPDGPYLRWNLAMGRITAAAMAAAIWTPAREAFPSLTCSNYDGMRAMDRPSSDMNGHQQPHDNVVGNAASPSLYGELGSIVQLFIDPSDPSRIAWSGSERLPRVPWSSFLLCTQRARACVRGAPSVPLLPWIANPSYRGDDPRNPVVPFPLDLRCYDENVRHSALLGTQTFLWWRADSESSPSDTARIDALVSEINARTLGRIAEPADVEPISFLSEVVVTGGRRHDGTWVWRVTAAPGVALLRESGTGKEWAPNADTLGFWVQTAEKIAPSWEVASRRARP